MDFSTASELFCTVVIECATVVSLFSNSLLLYVLHAQPSKQLGRYRVLLAIFAICNISTSLMHAVVQPIVYFTSTGEYIVSRQAGQRVLFGVSLDVALCQMYVVTFYQTFLILAYHYVYRYNTVTSSNAPPEILDIYGIDLTNPDVGFAGVVALRPCADSAQQDLCWYEPTAIAMLTTLGLSGATVAVIGYCIHRTRAAFSSASNVMSPATKRMQRNLFNALLIQTAVSCVLSYAPVVAIIVFPVVSGIALGEAGNLIFSITAIFPAIDSFFVLFFIARLRLTVIRLFRQSFAGSGIDGSSSNQKTTTVQHHKISVPSQNA